MAQKTSSQATTPAATLAATPASPVMSADAVVKVLAPLGFKAEFGPGKDGGEKKLEFKVQSDGSVKVQIPTAAAKALNDPMHPHDNPNGLTNLVSELTGSVNKFTFTDGPPKVGKAAKALGGLGALGRGTILGGLAAAGAEAAAAGAQSDHFMVIKGVTGTELQNLVDRALIFQKALNGETAQAENDLTNIYAQKKVDDALKAAPPEKQAEWTAFAGKLTSSAMPAFKPDGKGNVYTTMTSEQAKNLNDVLQDFKGDSKFTMRDIFGSDRFTVGTDPNNKPAIVYHYEDVKLQKDRDWDVNQFNSHDKVIKGVFNHPDDLEYIKDKIKVLGSGALLEMPQQGPQQGLDTASIGHGLPEGLKGPTARNRAPGVTFNS